MAFHAHGGWFFERFDDGSGSGNVRISHAPPGDLPTPEHEVVTFDAGTWGSIVAAVSRGGELKGRWYAAMDLHHGKSGDREGYA